MLPIEDLIQRLRDGGFELTIDPPDVPHRAVGRWWIDVFHLPSRKQIACVEWKTGEPFQILLDAFELSGPVSRSESADEAYDIIAAYRYPADAK